MVILRKVLDLKIQIHLFIYLKNTLYIRTETEHYALNEKLIKEKKSGN